ncbi:putative Membrane protein [Pseudomonas amygdali pv. eriobotryae]|uniref:Putative Membrane protein n=1 Tax=Pseudomonas amygdali pv. eriobotryae TaxID=129137 RepID=A0A3M3VWC9_PSEA0|nr:putative Membrane protein [Pseudomonas amygdali pv. eriobotryae]
MAVSPDFDNKNRTPGDSISLISAKQLRNGGLYAYTAINAPRGLDERIYHVWWHEGEEMDRIALDIHGGRKEGYRAWTRKQNFPEDVTGRWQVRVLTEDGQMIGVLRFVVTDNDQPAVKRPTGRIIKLKPGGDSAEEATPESAPADQPKQEKQEAAPAESAPAESAPQAPAQ